MIKEIKLRQSSGKTSERGLRKNFVVCGLVLCFKCSNVFTSPPKKKTTTTTKTPLLVIRLTKYYLSPSQTIATCKGNILPHNHCWAQHVTCLWPPCCDILGHVGCCWLKFENGQIWPSNTQHVANITTGWPNVRSMLGPTMLGYVALTCCDSSAAIAFVKEVCASSTKYFC